MQYLHGCRAALQRFAPHLKLRGPAGLFRSVASHIDSHHQHPSPHHPLCWGVLNACIVNRTACPIDTLTVHRKGTGTAASIVRASDILLAEFAASFPTLNRTFGSYRNTESDPTTGWSHPLPGNANVGYAAVLVETVLLHWNVVRQQHRRRRLPLLDGISHDNAFVGYHPFEFEQRTLLAHFRMNNTGQPPDVQIFEKPVYAAMGMVTVAFAVDAHVANGWQGAAEEDGTGCRWMVSSDDSFGSVVLVSGGQNVSQNVKLSKDHHWKDQIRVDIKTTYDSMDWWWMAEYLEQNTTDPHHVWQHNGRPSYPDAALRKRMRSVQVSHLL